MKKIFFISCASLLLLSNSAWADDLFKLVNIVEKLYGVNFDIKTTDLDSLDKLKDISQGLLGTHDYGALNYDSNQYSWGSNATSWQRLLTLYHTGESGEFAELAQRLAHDFPISNELNKENAKEDEYYRLQAQTTLASRTSSELAFDQISKESRVIEALHHEIDKTKDNKSAVDLNNRLQLEESLVTVQQTKLLATLVQQEAINSQEKALHAKENAEFFNTRK